ncbi:Hpt domain-containing protein [Phenylobacterium sp.]|uniref:Hpt domain-containing protein n=1 Tax=Phenylobacterium sp. TaxID=1871053 RepID=UPI003564381F
MTAQGTDGEVDFAYLEGYMAGDRQVVGEVLSLFRQQAQAWAGSLDPGDPGWRDVVHTIKGAARGVGARRLGDLCTQAEAQGAEGLPVVRAALEAVVAEIAAYQARA